MALQTLPVEASPSWRERWLAWRGRMLANPNFRRFSSAFWLTRPIARRRTRELFDICAGFVYSQILFACVRLKLFDVLAGGPQSTAEIARRVTLPYDNAVRLLRAAASLQLVESCGEDRYALGVLGAAMLGNPGVAAMVEHHAMLYADLVDPVALLRDDKLSTALGDYWAYARTSAPDTLAADQTADYSALMSASQSFIAHEVLDAYPLHQHTRLLDVGGGEGAFLRAAAQRAPNLKLMLFDLPAVAPRAQAKFDAAGLGARATAIGGSFLTDSLPRGADIISLVRVLHDHDDSSVRKILAACRAALQPGGTLLIAEPMAGTPGAEASGDGYFGFYLLAMGSGRPRNPYEITSLLGEFGFGNIRFRPTNTPVLTRVLTATSAAVVNR
jgi:demethylspheroidene O-methyltransferase